MYLLSVQYSCAVVSVFLFGRKANLVLLTLFYSTLLALTDWRTDGRTDRGTTTLALHGLEEPAHASRGLEERGKPLQTDGLTEERINPVGAG